MKMVILALAATLSMASLAHAESQCAFGESSWELKEEMDSDSNSKIWYKGEDISLTSEQRLKGLTAFERKMILASYDYQGATEKESLKDFVSSDGYITYFHPNSDRREFVIVASYPGDNEFGSVYEITKVGNKQQFELVAAITDGDFEDCKVLKGQVK